jgi:CRISPR-associated protein Cmr6
LLDRYLLDNDRIARKETPEPRDWQRITDIRPPRAYSLAFERWKRTLGQSRFPVLHEASCAGRFVTGLGAEGVFEVNIRLHHTYGVPLVPGSGVKGALRAYLEGLGSREEAAFLFGQPDSAGYAQVHDGWWIPGSAGPAGPGGLALDVISVHHPDYYAGRPDSSPTDFDQPIPVHFLTAQGKFLFAVSAPSEEWRSFVAKLLRDTLGSGGLGAKKASGYGRFSG